MKRLRVVSRDSLERLVDLTVARTARALGAGGDDAAARRFRETLRRELSRAIHDEARAVRAVSKREFLLELARSKDRLLFERSVVAAELRELKQMLQQGHELPREAAVAEAKEQPQEQPLQGPQPPDGVSSDDASQRRIQLLERRLEKLRHELKLADDRLAQFAEDVARDPGLASIHRSIVGLRSGEERYEDKKKMLSAVFEANLELRRGMAEQ